MIEVGRVVSLFRYPVKSMAASPLDAVDVGWNGLDGDRRWAFVREGQTQNGFPWLTLRERPEMGHYQPGVGCLVRTPAGRMLDVADPALAAELGDGVRVMKQDRGIFDTMPISLLSIQSLASLGALLGGALDVQRFRPNLVVDAHGNAPFPEDAWVGRILRIGDARMRVDQRDGRCVVVTIDPVTTARRADVLRAIARERGGMFGVCGSTVRPGRVSAGDSVWLEE